jgi:hypothetical protein
MHSKSGLGHVFTTAPTFEKVNVVAARTPSAEA